MGLEPRFSSHGALSSVLNGKNLDKMSERDGRGKETDSNVHCCILPLPQVPYVIICNTSGSVSHYFGRDFWGPN